jgi:recombination protein RecA
VAKTGKSGLTALLGMVEKRFGKGAMMNMSDDAAKTVKVFSTGSLGLDAALGTGGLPFGRVSEIYGPESSGKTTLTLQAIAEVQKGGGVAAFIDAEHALDVGYARALGVDVDRLLISQPDCGEQALELADMLARSGEVDLIVIDSVAALTPRAEVDGDMGDHHVGLQARMMSQALRKLTAAAHREGTAIIFINQLRVKIGVTFGNPETTTGGNALKFYSSVRLDIRRIGAVKDSEGEAFGNKTRVKVAKNKLAPPFRQAEFEIVYGRGTCLAGEIIDHGTALGIIERAGAWYALDGEKLGQGRERTRDTLMKDPALLEATRLRVLDAMLKRPAEPPVAAQFLEEAA